VVLRFVLRGLLAGAVAGACAGTLGLLVGEPVLDRAIGIEDHAGGGDPEVSRSLQRLGLVLATGLYGVAIGGLVGLVFAAMRGRTAHRDDARLALALTAALFAAAVAVPFLKYPAAPPGVGDPETIGRRTELYLLLVGGSLAALLAAWRVAAALPERRPALRTIVGLVTFCALAGLLAVALPGVDEVPAGYPSGLLDDFRLASGALQLTLWSVLGIGFAVLSGLRPDLRRRPPR
jgi:hypothetical protein